MTTNERISKTPARITLCHYDSGKLIIEDKRWGDCGYVAVSHVWGSDVKETRLTSTRPKVPLSKEKAKFLQEQFPSIIGKEWFWMDVLCIDQSDEKSRVAVTQYIPAIFRSALKTIVVRDSTGLRPCCRQATDDLIEALSTQRDFRGFYDHYAEHQSHLPRGEDGILTRLWPLQEILLSNNLHFVQCNVAIPEPFKEIDFFRLYVRVTSTFMTLRRLATSWRNHGDERASAPLKDLRNFVRAFVMGGTVSRPGTPQSNTDTLVHLLSFENSPRRTTVPRDFILATMPQCHWYSVPANAKAMSFPEIFRDCATQALQANDVVIGPLVSAAKTNLMETICTPIAADTMPTPNCLSDFVRLLVGLQPAIRRWYHPRKVQQVDLHMIMGTTALIPALSLIRSTIERSTSMWDTTIIINTLPDMSFLTSLQYPIKDWEFDQFSLLVLMFTGNKMGVYGSGKVWDNIFRAIVSRTVHKTSTDIDLQSGAVQRWVIVERLWESVLENIMKMGTREIDSLIRLAASISCGFDMDHDGWAKKNLTPVSVNIGNREVICLVYSNLLEEYRRRECLFHIIECNGAVLLVSERPKYSAAPYLQCFWPGDWKIWTETALPELELHRIRSGKK